MAKFRNPFGSKELWITQTYHTGSNNTAVDFSAVAGTPVYAVADGKVTYRSSGYGSYCIQHIDNSDLIVYYVHTYKWVGANTQVKKGQIIARIAPTTLNGGHPTHLHLGLQIGKYLMNYLDRSITMKTRFPANKNIWFKGESFDWSKHKDLSYLNNAMSFKKGDKIEFTGSQNVRTGSGTTFPIQSSANVGDVATIIDGPRTANNYTWWDMKFDKGGTGWVADVNKMEIYVKPPTPPEPPEPTECEKEVEGLKLIISELELTIEAQEGTINALANSKEDLEAQVKNLSAELELEEEMLSGVQAAYDLLDEKYQECEKQNLELVKNYNECKRKLGEGQQNFIKKITDWVGEILSKIMGDE